MEEKLLQSLSLLSEVNSAYTYTESYIIIDQNSLSGWMDGILNDILPKIDPENYSSHSQFHRRLHFYYDKDRTWVDSYYLTHPYLLQIVKTIGHWALVGRQVEIRIIEIPVCQEIVGIKDGQFQYSKITDPVEALRRIEARKSRDEWEKKLLPAEKVHEVIMKEVDLECKRWSAEFDAPAHAKWAEERTVKMKAPVL